MIKITLVKRILTYMSIRTEWLAHLAGERLCRLEPFPGDRKVRTVLMSQEINSLVSGPWDDEEMGERCGRLLATLQRIVRGEILVVCMVPFKAREAQIGRLDPVEDSVFDIRSREEPGLRVFCRFAEKDVLIASVCAPRSMPVSWLARLPLGDGYSRQWRRAVYECKDHWTKLFPAYDPVKGDNLNDYLSNARLERTRSGP
jgi:hypothetical protein